MKEYKIKRTFVNKVWREFQAETKAYLPNVAVAKWLIEYSIAKFIIQSNKNEKD
jgi:hypothetical protein